MTIKDMEARFGMTRANIRFYESEGLLLPARTENGYRDYSEEDLAVLKRIRLLRTLGVSLEEIKKVQSGGEELSDVLKARQEALEREQFRLESCRRICREMQEDRVRYDTLNAQKYLDSIHGSGADSLPASDQTERPWAPWRRFFARTFDFFLFTLLWKMLLACLCSRAFFTAFPFGIVSLITMLFLEPLLLWLFGTTPGKWIVGIRITDDIGGKLPYSKGLVRTLSALWWGMGMGIPLFSIFRLVVSYKAYYKDTTLSWEYDSEEMIRENRAWRGVVLIGVSAVLILCFAAELAEIEKPLHRGNLTVAQFAENYNHYQWYYFGRETVRYLDVEGQFARKEFYDPYTVIVDVTGGNVAEPIIAYTEKDGTVAEIYMELRGDSVFLFGDDEITLAFLSFALAQPGWNRREAEQVLSQLFDDSHDHFQTTVHGIEITYEYQNVGSVSSPEIVERFTMRKAG